MNPTVSLQRRFAHRQNAITRDDGDKQTIINLNDPDAVIVLSGWIAKVWLKLDGQTNLDQIVNTIAIESAKPMKWVEENTFKTVAALMDMDLIEEQI